MPPLAIALALAAAVLHVAWNVLLKTSEDPLRTAVRLQVVAALLLGPAALVAWLAGGRPAPHPGGIALVLGSAVLETLYFLFLSTAYRGGALSLVYPIARGSAPLLAVAAGVAVLGEHLTPGGWAGVAALLTGILLVVGPWRAVGMTGATDRRAVGFALATGATIAAYSAVDRVGVRLMEPWLYAALLAVATAVLLTAVAAAGRRSGRIQSVLITDPGSDRRSARRDVAAGVLSAAGYLLVLIAYSVAPLAAVAPLRESGIVLAAAWGAVRLGEASDRGDAGRSVAAAGLVVAGAGLLALAG